jgi:hypothetical protein
MGFIIRDLWTTETPGPITAFRAFDVLIALIGTICIAVGSDLLHYRMQPPPPALKCQVETRLTG